MSKNNDGLFLLEVLVDKIVFSKSPCFSDKDFRTCVTITCLSVEPLEICDDDAACTSHSGGPFTKTFNTGKSCLFSLKEAEINSAMTKFPIQVLVHKSLPCGCLPTKIVMGEAHIDMTKEFVQARNKYLEDPTCVSYQALKDNFRLIGQDKAATGEITLFLRISCFGKLIVTKFQGAGGQVTLGAGGSTGVHDRSCNPSREFQSLDEPCVCGVGHGPHGLGPGGQVCKAGGRGGGAGPCQPARDPYGSMPCEDPDDPCYCSGPKQSVKPHMACRNTDPYCLHVPKGSTLPSWKFIGEDLEQRYDMRNTDRALKGNEAVQFIQSILNINESSTSSLSSLSTIRSKKRSVSFVSTIEPRVNYLPVEQTLFGKETTVYMTFWNTDKSRNDSGTQATASINKCLQVPCENHNASSCLSTSNPSSVRSIAQGRCHEVYFFGRKWGMGSSDPNPEQSVTKEKGKKNKNKMEKTSAHTIMTTEVKNEKQKITGGTSTALSIADAATQNHIDKDHSKPAHASHKDHSEHANTSHKQGHRESVSHGQNQEPQTPACATRGDLTAIVSHIKIGPKDPLCPIHGKDPCSGPKCSVALSKQDQAPVKVTTAANSRRGVFELVIRRISGAPLARNELMLEWTPPPCHFSPCGGPITVACFPSGAGSRPSKLVTCRPAPSKPKCCRKLCNKPCGAAPCTIKCRKCCRPSCCGNPCRFPKPPCCSSARPKCCNPPPCKPRPCAQVHCCSGKPCKSSPCLRPCPVGRKRARRIRSYPRIKPHSKLVSPCLNRSKCCPVVRCNSMPGPCFSCLPCPPRKCSSVGRCRPPNCCNSISTCS